MNNNQPTVGQTALMVIDNILADHAAGTLNTGDWDEMRAVISRLAAAEAEQLANRSTISPTYRVANWHTGDIFQSIYRTLEEAEAACRRINEAMKPQYQTFEVVTINFKGSN
jgi:predicted nucleic acid-binding Zn ribbon protein